MPYIVMQMSCREMSYVELVGFMVANAEDGELHAVTITLLLAERMVEY